MSEKHKFTTATKEETKSGKGRISKQSDFLSIVEEYKGREGILLSELEKYLGVKKQTIRSYARNTNTKYDIRKKGSSSYIFFE